MQQKKSDVTIYGDVENIKCEGSVSCDNVKGNINAGGSVSCDDVGGSIECGGSVHCDSIAGDVKAGGSISMQEDNMKLSKEERLEKALYNWIDANDVVEEDITSMIERT